MSLGDQSCPRVGLNAHLLGGEGSYRGAGIHSYIYHLLHHLPQADAQLAYTAFMGRFRDDLPGLRLCRSVLPTEFPWMRILWEQAVQPWMLHRYQIELAHGLAYALPLVVACPTIVTVYDLAFFRLPGYFRPWNRLYLKAATRLSTQRAAQVIAISQNTKQELVQILGIPAEKIWVIPPGTDPRFRPIDDSGAIAAFRHRRGLPKQMIFYLGTLEPRKNLVSLLQAYALLRKMKPAAPTLVLGGAKGWYYEEIFATIERFGLADNVRLPGYIPGDELVWWYNAADCFVYPSFYEGFGLPVVEAMACGTPVVTSNTASLPEVIGSAGLTVPPEDVEKLANAMSTALYDTSMREKAHHLGIQQAALFSWPRAAAQTAKLYRKVLGLGDGA